MDHFGIGAAMLAMSAVYTTATRRSGRTTSLIEDVKDGDRIVFAHSHEAQRVERILLERGLKVQCIVVDVRDPHQLLRRGTSQGRTIFDHSWIEEYYNGTIKHAAETIDRMERETSGYGEPHRETQRRAIELAKWRPWAPST